MLGTKRWLRIAEALLVLLCAACHSRSSDMATEGVTGLSEILCSGHTMTQRSMYAKQNKDGHVGQGGTAVDS